MNNDMLTTEELGYPELLEDLAAAAGELLRDKMPNLAPDAAAEIGIALAEHMRRHWGGQSFYVPQGRKFEASQKHMDIWREFNGRNYRQLARKHSVTLQHVYVVVRRMREQLRNRHQPQLF